MSNICSNLILTRTNVFDKVYLESGDKNAKSNKKGRIEIEYYSEEDLERIVSLLEPIK